MTITIFAKNIYKKSKFANLLEKSSYNKDIYIGDIISVKIIGFKRNFVIVRTNLKSDIFIPISEFKKENGDLEVSIGDSISVYIEKLENGLGNIVLSRNKAKRLFAWYLLEKAMDLNSIITGKITGKVKGGLTVITDCNIRAFLPGSLIDIRPVKDTSIFEGKNLNFKVIKLDRKRNNVVLSRKAIIEDSMSKERKKLIKMLNDGSIINGIVKNITDYGVFIDLGGVDGLLHITDLAWRRIRHPSEIINLGQEILVKILKYDREKNRVSLGIKQLGDDPWTGLSKKYPYGTRLFGKVTNITDYGAFVEVESGIEGLVHISEMNWTNKNISPKKVVKLGKVVEVMILEVDETRRRISLGMKYCLPNPWVVFSKRYKKGDTIESKIKSITEFGIFVKLPENIDGLIHISDLSLINNKNKSLHNIKKGTFIKTILSFVDIKRERVSLSIKKLLNNSFMRFIKFNKKGSLVSGIVKKIRPRIIIINLFNSLEGYFITSRSFNNFTRTLNLRNILLPKIGDKINAFVLNINYKLRSIILLDRKNYNFNRKKINKIY